MGNKLCIRTDASPKIGLGHITRCLTLAKSLKSDFSISFYCCEIPAELIKSIEESGFTFNRINNNDDFLQNLNTKDGVILDGYHFDYGLQKSIKDKGCILICIDDLADREFYCDLIINHSPGISPTDYKVPSFTKFALGTKYALLRPEFLEKIHEPRTLEKIENVFVCFGGSDYPDLTCNIAEILAENYKFKQINIVVGVSYIYTKILELTKKNTTIKLHRNIDALKMIDIMKNSQLAIVPASGILLEIFTIKMPVITGYYAPNQERFYNYLLKKNIITGVDDFTKIDENSIKKAINSILNQKISEIISKQYFLMKDYDKNNINNIIKNLWAN